MADQAKNILIGLFVIAAGCIAVFILMFLHPTVGDDKRTLRVRFSNIDKVSLGTRVNYAGRPVGEVVKISEIENARNGRQDVNGRVFVYELELRVDSGVHVYSTDDVALRTSGLLGERNIEISPMPLQSDEPVRLIDDEIIYSAQTGNVEDAVKELKEAADKLDNVLDAARDVLNQIRNRDLVGKLVNTLENIESITDALNQPEQLRDLLANASATALNFEGITTSIRAGSGSLGQLLMRDETALQLNALLAKAEVVLNDINHYGLMFHSDKGWQRLRARRMNLLQQLSCPQEFRNFFNDELDSITTSLERVTYVLDNTCELPCYCQILDDKEFGKVFGELLRRVSKLDEELRMYNIQLSDCFTEQFELSGYNSFIP